jgi:hypothetical protein
MTDHDRIHRYPGDPFAIFELSRDMLLAQQKLMPSTRFFERYTEATRAVAQAHVNYCQALMRAHAIMLGAVLERPGLSSMGHDQRPSVAAKKSEFTAS